jgi:hypothetical protein
VVLRVDFSIPPEAQRRHPRFGGHFGVEFANGCDGALSGGLASARAHSLTVLAMADLSLSVAPISSATRGAASGPRVLPVGGKAAVRHLLVTDCSQRCSGRTASGTLGACSVRAKASCCCAGKRPCVASQRPSQ